MIDLILATDMKQHFALTSLFTQKLCSSSSSRPSSGPTGYSIMDTNNSTSALSPGHEEDCKLLIMQVCMFGRGGQVGDLGSIHEGCKLLVMQACLMWVRGRAAGEWQVQGICMQSRTHPCTGCL